MNEQRVTERRSEFSEAQPGRLLNKTKYSSGECNWRDSDGFSKECGDKVCVDAIDMTSFKKKRPRGCERVRLRVRVGAGAGGCGWELTSTRYRYSSK